MTIEKLLDRYKCYNLYYNRMKKLLIIRKPILVIEYVFLKKVIKDWELPIENIIIE